MVIKNHNTEREGQEFCIMLKLPVDTRSISVDLLVLAILEHTFGCPYKSLDKGRRPGVDLVTSFFCL